MSFFNLIIFLYRKGEKRKKEFIMVDGISTEQAVINQVMAALPEVKSKKEYTLNYGDSLWDIAKRELGDKKLTNREIRDYMLLIAKLNNLTTVEKMNGLYANQKIYLPLDIAGKKINDPQARTDLEKSVDNVINILQNDKTIYVRKATPDFINLYHIFHKKAFTTGYPPLESHLLCFSLDKNDKIKSVAIDDVENLNHISLDYEIDANGKTKTNIYPKPPVQQLKQEDKEALFKEIYNQYENYKKNPQRFY